MDAFLKKNKALVIIGAIVLLGLLYYYFAVYLPAKNAITANALAAANGTTSSVPGNAFDANDELATQQMLQLVQGSQFAKDLSWVLEYFPNYLAGGINAVNNDYITMNVAGKIVLPKCASFLQMMSSAWAPSYESDQQTGAPAPGIPAATAAAAHTLMTQLGAIWVNYKTTEQAKII